MRGAFSKSLNTTFFERAAHAHDAVYQPRNARRNDIIPVRTRARAS
jgi:hypothetical protein